jgi:hypothetical protein
MFSYWIRIISMVKNRSIFHIFPLIALLFLVSCSGKDTTIPNTSIPMPPVVSPSPEITVENNKSEKQPTAETEVDVEVDEEELVMDSAKVVADVISVDISGSPNQYYFSVGVQSPDTGCEQYADWWEILDESGNLIYRRILLHSHVNDQPFTRSGGPVDIGPNTVVIIRAHMNEVGYGGLSSKGTPNTDFTFVELPPDFAPGVEEESPLPTGCNF